MYIKKTYQFKNSIEVEKMYSARFGKKGMKHNAKTNPSPEAMKKHNRKKCADNLRRLIKLNFQSGWHMTLTYRKDDRPDRALAKRYVNNFLRRMKYWLSKEGVELKYILVTEYENKAIHHHIIINDSPNLIKLVGKQWPHGQANFTLLYVDDDVATLAEYLIKETDKTFREDPDCKLRYTCSRNLEKPEPRVEIIKANEFRKEPKIPKGYILEADSLVNGVSSATGYEYQSYRLTKIPEKGKRNERQKKPLRGHDSGEVSVLSPKGKTKNRV